MFLVSQTSHLFHSFFSPASLKPQTPLALRVQFNIYDVVGVLSALASIQFTEKQLCTSTPFISEMLANWKEALTPQGAIFFFRKIVNTDRIAVCKLREISF